MRVDILERLADLIRPVSPGAKARRDRSRRALSQAAVSHRHYHDFAHRRVRRVSPPSCGRSATGLSGGPNRRSRLKPSRRKPRSRRQQTRRPPLSKRTRRSLPTRTWPTLQPRLRWRRPKPSTQRTKRSRLRRLRLSWLQPKYRLRHRRCRPSRRRMRHPRPGQHLGGRLPATPAERRAGAAELEMIEVAARRAEGRAADRKHRERGRHFGRRDGPKALRPRRRRRCGRRPRRRDGSAGGAAPTKLHARTHSRNASRAIVAAEASKGWRRAAPDRPRRDRDRPPNAARHESKTGVPNAGRGA